MSYAIRCLIRELSRCLVTLVILRFIHIKTSNFFFHIFRRFCSRRVLNSPVRFPRPLMPLSCCCFHSRFAYYAIFLDSFFFVFHLADSFHVLLFQFLVLARDQEEANSSLFIALISIWKENEAERRAFRLTLKDIRSKGSASRERTAWSFGGDLGTKVSWLAPRESRWKSPWDWFDADISRDFTALN